MTDDLNTKIGALLKTKREAKKLSLRDVAPLVGKTRSTISYYESGKFGIDVSMLNKFCHVYGIDMYDFLDEVRKCHEI